MRATRRQEDQTHTLLFARRRADESTSIDRPQAIDGADVCCEKRSCCRGAHWRAAPPEAHLCFRVLESLFAMIMMLTSLHHSNVNRCRALFCTTPACQPRTAMLQWMWSPTGALAHATAPTGAHLRFFVGRRCPHAGDSASLHPLAAMPGGPRSTPWASHNLLRILGNQCFNANVKSA